MLSEVLDALGKLFCKIVLSAEIIDGVDKVVLVVLGVGVTFFTTKFSDSIDFVVVLCCATFSFLLSLIVLALSVLDCVVVTTIDLISLTVEYERVVSGNLVVTVGLFM